MTYSTASPAEAAAIAAAIEQFLRDTTPASQAPEPQMSPWQRAGLFEGVGMPADSNPPWR